MPHETITPDLLLSAYASGYFPMSEDRLDPSMFWVDPVERGVFPLETFSVSKSLKKTIRQDKFRVTRNTAFQQVMQRCAAPAADRETTWISERIESLYVDLHQRGFAHSIECWLDDTLVGGLYGVCLRGAFFGESMFHTATDASKVALVHLVAALKSGGFILLDTQFITDHLASLGAIEISREAYHSQLKDAIACETAVFPAECYSFSGVEALQLSTQTS